jgi:hypothetical protein
MMAASIYREDNNMDFEITTIEELNAIQSLIAKAQQEFVAQGKTHREARYWAAQQVGETYDPPANAKEVERAVGIARAKFYAEERKSGMQRAKDEKRAAAENAERTPAKHLYRKWCAENKYVTSDTELAFFCGVTVSVFGHCRRDLIEEGFIFTRNGNGWIIEQPPIVERTYTEKEVRTMMDELLSKYGKHK